MNPVSNRYGKENIHSEAIALQGAHGTGQDDGHVLQCSVQPREGCLQVQQVFRKGGVALAFDETIPLEQVAHNPEEWCHIWGNVYVILKDYNKKLLNKSNQEKQND